MNTLPELTEQTVTSNDCCGWTWALPVDPLCAREARCLLAGKLGTLEVPRDVVADAELMISELATNAYRHARSHGPHELWIFASGQLRGTATGPDPCEVVCAVFDTLPEPRLRTDAAFCGDFGRGLSIVAELSHGRWGVQPARSHLRYGVPGKAVWFGCAVPPAVVERMGRQCEDRRHLKVT